MLKSQVFRTKALLQVLPLTQIVSLFYESQYMYCVVEQDILHRTLVNIRNRYNAHTSKKAKPEHNYSFTRDLSHYFIENLAF
jgi:hypothetical protein